MDTLKGIIDDTGLMVLKASSGLIFLLFSEAVFAICADTDFEILKFLFNLYVNVSNEIGSVAAFILAYIVFWSYGQVIYILRQFVMNLFKSNYSNDKTFEALRNIVTKKVKEKYPELEQVELNDYLLYLILGKNYSNNKTGEADLAAFFVIMMSISAIIAIIYYLTPKIDYSNCLASLVLISLCIIAWWLAIRFISSRLVSRNIRVYLNYITRND